MIEYRLNIGDVTTSVGNTTYTCFGLGSCIGLFIQDRTTDLSGGAHIFLPENKSKTFERNKFYCVVTAFNEILNQFKTKGSDLTSLRAKVTGGANVVGLQTSTGILNSEAVVKQLICNRIFIAAMDIGGIHSRTVQFESKTGLLKVRKPGIDELKIY